MKIRMMALASVFVLIASVSLADVLTDNWQDESTEDLQVAIQLLQAEVDMRLKAEYAADAGVTLENYNKITLGMDYDTVCVILGDKGECSLTMDMGGILVETYTWKGNKYESVIIGFEDHAVKSMMQIGLK